MSRAIASLGSGPHEQLLWLAAKSFRPFAARHGYELHLHTEAVDESRPAPWSKIRILQELLERYEDVLWLDSDLMIVDGREDLPSTRVMGLVQHEIGSETMPNSGVWLLHSSPETKRFLEEVWNQEDLIDHRWWENAAICRLLGYTLDPVRPGEPTEWLERTDFFDASWNSIPSNPSPRPRIKHYPGYKTRTRKAFMMRDNLFHRRHR